MKVTKKTRRGAVVLTLVFVLAFGIILIYAGCRLDSGSGPSSSPSGTRPGTPHVTAALSSTKTSINVSWSSVSGAEGYYVYRSLDVSGSPSRVETTSYTSYTDTMLSAGTTYYYTVSAWNNAGVGNSSSPAWVTIVPAVPGNVTANAISAVSIRVTWDSVYGATGYNVYRSTDYPGSYSLAGSALSTAYTDIDLSPDTTYYYTVSAYNIGGESNQSTSDWATTWQ